MIKSLIIAKERIVGLDGVINVSSSYLLNLSSKTETEICPDFSPIIS